MLLDVARGMKYLHTRPDPIIHKGAAREGDASLIMYFINLLFVRTPPIIADLKSHNVLIDKDWIGKVADFGKVRTELKEQNTHCEIIKATRQANDSNPFVPVSLPSHSRVTPTKHHRK